MIEHDWDKIGSAVSKMEGCVFQKGIIYRKVSNSPLQISEDILTFAHYGIAVFDHEDYQL